MLIDFSVQVADDAVEILSITGYVPYLRLELIVGVVQLLLCPGQLADMLKMPTFLHSQLRVLKFKVVE